MFRLIRTELNKMLKKRSTILCFIALLLIMIGLGVTEYQDVAIFNENAAYKEEVMSWEEREETLIKFAGESLQDPWYDSLQKDQIQRRIDVAEYRLENNIPKDIYKNVWWFFNDNSFNVVSTIVIIMIIIIGSTNIAGEYSNKTLRQVLLLPYKRWKILLSKLCAIIIMGLSLYGVLFVLGLGSGLVIHKLDGINSQVVLYFGNSITTMNMSVYSIIVVLLKLVEIIFYSVFVLLICILTKRDSASMLITGACAVFAIPISNFLVSYYPSFNYIPFLNLDFRKYLDFGTTMPVLERFFGSFVVQGITPITSIIIVIITIALFMGISIVSFNKQDL